MKLYIPEIGDRLRLVADWTFGLYNESRNATLMEKIGDKRECTWGGNNYGTIPCTIPTGALLKVDRIYIRKGISEYSSITFLWVGERTEPRVEQRMLSIHSTARMINSSYAIKVPRKPIRFWAKLNDVNNLEFEKA